MPRGTSSPSDVFKTVLRQAERELLLGGSRAEAFVHRGIRGDERAAALGEFFRKRLPSRFGIGKGEAIDYQDERTGQLDLIIYDAAGAAPVSAQAENVLLPCEAVYVVIEVKTTLTKGEAETAYGAAGRVRGLKPFKSRFVAPRQDGSPADDDAHRCMYIVFAYSTDLADDSDWLDKEYERASVAARTRKVATDCVDRIVVLGRGMLNPGAGTGKSETASDESIFLESYLHIVNFLMRESRRRQPIDWQMYGPRRPKGWRTLGASKSKPQPVSQ